MKIQKGMTYHILELPDGIIITYDRVPPGRSAIALVKADLTDLIAYQHRYLLARESGLNLNDAHKAALADAVVINPPQPGVVN